MIVPWLQGFLSRHKAPLTWTLVLICTYLFLVMMTGQRGQHQRYFQKEQNAQLTETLYTQFLKQTQNPGVSTSSVNVTEALTDSNFLEKAESFKFKGDVLKIQEWQKSLHEYRNSLGVLPSFVFGLSSKFHGLANLITYQFLHASVIHLLSNMFLLVVFGCAVETLIGSLGFIFLFVACGIAGGSFFLLLSQGSTVPVIGASGSISGLMAFYAVYEFRTHVRYYFFLSPLPDYHGVIYLSKYWIFPLFFLADLSSLYAESLEGFHSASSEGVAYAAHIGGMLCGIVLGYLAKSYKDSQQRLPSLLTHFK